MRPGNPRNRRKPWEPSPQQLANYELVLSGKISQRQLAKQLGRDESTLYRIFKRIDRWLVPQYMDRIREIKANHTLRLMLIHTRALAEFERSRVNKVVRRKKPGKEKEAGLIIEDRIEGRVGDPQLLTVALKALEDVRKIWGMNAAEQIQGETILRVGGLPHLEAMKRRQAEITEAINDAASQDSDTES